MDTPKKERNRIKQIEIGQNMFTNPNLSHNSLKTFRYVIKEIELDIGMQLSQI